MNKISENWSFDSSWKTKTNRSENNILKNSNTHIINFVTFKMLKKKQKPRYLGAREGSYKYEKGESMKELFAVGLEFNV